MTCINKTILTGLSGTVQTIFQLGFKKSNLVEGFCAARTTSYGRREDQLRFLLWRQGSPQAVPTLIDCVLIHFIPVLWRAGDWALEQNC